MKIATYNVNGVNGRFPMLLSWLEDGEPDIVCLQELKAPQEKFPESAIRNLGYDAIWFGQKSWTGVAILSRVGDIHETRRGLPGDPDDNHSRYIEAAVNGIPIGASMASLNAKPTASLATAFSIATSPVELMEEKEPAKMSIPPQPAR